MPLNISGCASFKVKKIDGDNGPTITGSFTYEWKGDNVPGGTQDFWDNSNKFAAVSDDPAPELGGDLGLNSRDIILTEPASDHSWESTDTIIDTIKTGEGGLFALMYKGSDGEWVEADKNSYATRCTRMMLSATTSGTQKLMKSGLVRDDSWNWTPGSELYLGAAGAITDDVSAYTTGNVQQIIGKAETADIVDFDPEKGGVEVA
jgi:hypothetical protein